MSSSYRVKTEAVKENIKIACGVGGRFSSYVCHDLEYLCVHKWGIHSQNKFRKNWETLQKIMRMCVSCISSYTSLPSPKKKKGKKEICLAIMIMFEIYTHTYHVLLLSSPRSWLRNWAFVGFWHHYTQFAGLDNVTRCCHLYITCLIFKLYVYWLRWYRIFFGRLWGNMNESFRIS